ncbi:MULTISPECIES: response regulator transcription factor [unclassified Lactococcus]|uniref:response regulator transcription factor n=1 Tax=unclassified Lactococcus TaxID=2643510 RepID=UPI0011C9FC00|nr:MULTISPECIES: response regulator transcription factor [unclassified Lactococcus]MQW23789.1 response regulator [Lactococcus sp. dk101]TXK37386.1 response regulator transcription factor [Lactococcus sp. dk310]TXK48697.1 response regulator transcription factor [Lactococcus sp. dk322]
MKRILIADDDRSILTLLSFNFRQDDFEVMTAANGKQALDIAKKNPFDLILLDLMMPEYNGIEVTEILRKKENYTPILILTARDDDEVKLRGFQAGSDEYLDKSTPMKEILVRANALIRRSQMYNKVANIDNSQEMKSEVNYQNGELLVDFQNKEIHFKGQPLDLTKREFEILELLIHRKNEVVSRAELLKHFWGISDAAETRTIDVLISKIRKKLDNQYIKTKRGFGYTFKDEEN